MKRTLLGGLLSLLFILSAGAGEITIGTGTYTATDFPIKASSSYSITQQLYTLSELGNEPYTIEAIAFNRSNSPSATRLLDIYMVETDKLRMINSNEWVEVTADDLVFSGEVTFEGPGWNNIPLTSTFAYSGTKNLALIVNDRTGNYSSSTISFYKTNLSSYQVLYYSRSTEAFDATNMSSISGYRTMAKSNLRLTTADAPTSAKPTSLVVGAVDAYSATVTWGGEGTAWSLQYKKASDAAWTTVEGLTTPSYTLTGLDPTTGYVVRVQAVDGHANSLWTGTTFTTLESDVATPTAVTCTAVTATTATLSWTENGSATQWQISVLDGVAGESRFTADSNPYTVTGLTAETIHSAQVRAVSGSGYSSWSTPATFESTAKTTIGTASSTWWVVPVYIQGNYSLSQQIYTTEELGTTPCSFTSIDFYNKNKASIAAPVRNIDIYIVPTDKTTFDSNTDWVTVTDEDRVFRGTVTFTPQAWTMIPFDVPYVHDGTHNAVVVIDDNTGSNSNSTNFTVFTGSGYQTLSAYGSGGNYNPLSPSGYYGSKDNRKNHIRLMPAPYPTCQRPTGLTVSDITKSSAVLTWTSEGDRWDLKVDGDIIEGITTTSYTLTNLTMATAHEVQVRTNCGGGNVSAWTNVVSFVTVLCDEEDQCLLTYELTNSVGYEGWSGNAILVEDMLTGAVIARLTFDSGTSTSGSLAVCNGRQLKFSWDYGESSYNCSYTIRDVNGEVIVTGNGQAIYTPVTYTVDCTLYLPKPTELTCSAVTATTATLSWTENGTATQWQLCVNGDEENLIAANSNPFVLTGLTTEIPHTVKIRSVNGAEISLWSAEVSFEPTDKLCIGTGKDTHNSIPTDINCRYSLSEQIYTAAELGNEAKTITAIDFYKSSSGEQTRSMDIYMVPTTLNKFSSNKSWVSVAAGDLVFSGSVTFTGGAWTPVTLDAPFEYDGESNVLLVVDDNTGGYSSTSYFYTFNDETYRTLYYRYDYSNPDPTKVISDIGGGIIQARNQIRLAFGDAPAVLRPTSFAVPTINAHNAWVRWTEKGKATQWQLCVNDDEDHLISVTKQSYQLTGLSAETTYTVKVRAVKDGQTSRWTGPVSFTTEANEAPYALTADDIGPNSAVLTWQDASDITAWQLCVNGDEEHLISVSAPDVDPLSPAYTLTGLTAETEYTVKVRSVYADETCPWSDKLVFSTTEVNPVPRKISTTAAHTSATVGWLGISDSYNVRYRKAPSITPTYTEGFEGGLNGWTLSNSTEKTGTYEDETIAHSGNGLFVFFYTKNPPQYLISPELPAVTDGMMLQFYYRNYDSGYPETFQIGFSSTTADTDAFTFGDVITADDEAWHRYRVAIPAGTKYICGKHTSDDQWLLFIDDITIGTPTETGEWQTVTATEAAATLTGLTADTDYELQVQGIVGENLSAWSDVTTFTTIAADVKIFMTDGNWNDASNWEPAAVPTADDDVIIQAAAVIPNGVVAWARNITIAGIENNGGGGASAPMMTAPAAQQTAKGNTRRAPAAAGTPGITVKDGGQLRHATEDLFVTVEKDIAGYGENKTGGYRLIALPLNGSWYPTEDNGLTSGSYDLYSFDADSGDGLEWRNFKAESFWFYPNNEEGYLYANSADQTLTFTGTTDETYSGISYYSIMPVDGDVTPFTNGWRVFANNAVANAYMEFGNFDDEDNFFPGTCNFYKMNASGDGYSLFKDYVAVAPGEAVFVEAATTGRLHWSYDALRENAPVAEKDTYTKPILPRHGSTLHQDGHIVKGDANGDGEVTITDAVSIVNYILGNPSPGFVIEAANVNGDVDDEGKPVISITDAVGVVNIILTK